MRPASPDEIIEEALDLIAAGAMDREAVLKLILRNLNNVELAQLLGQFLPNGLDLIRTHLIKEDVDNETMDSLRHNGYSHDESNFILSVDVLDGPPEPEYPVPEPFRTLLQLARRDGIRFIRIRFNRCHYCGGVYERLTSVEVFGVDVRVCEECAPHAYGF